MIKKLSLLVTLIGCLSVVLTSNAISQVNLEKESYTKDDVTFYWVVKSNEKNIENTNFLLDGENVRPDSITPEKRPLVVGMLLDLSGSISSKGLRKIKDNAYQFIDFLDVKDVLGVWSVADKTRLEIPLETGACTGVGDCLKSVKLRGQWTRLYDAIISITSDLKTKADETHLKPVLVLFTDGFDEKSFSTLDDVYKAIEQTNIPLLISPIKGNKSANLKLLKKWANVTGGDISLKEVKPFRQWIDNYKSQLRLEFQTASAIPSSTKGQSTEQTDTEKAAQSQVTTDPTNEVPDDNETSSFSWIWILLAILILLLLFLIWKFLQSRPENTQTHSESRTNLTQTSPIQAETPGVQTTVSSKTSSTPGFHAESSEDKTVVTSATLHHEAAKSEKVSSSETKTLASRLKEPEPTGNSKTTPGTNPAKDRLAAINEIRSRQSGSTKADASEASSERVSSAVDRLNRGGNIEDRTATAMKTRGSRSDAVQSRLDEINRGGQVNESTIRSRVERTSSADRINRLRSGSGDTGLSRDNLDLTENRAKRLEEIGGRRPTIDFSRPETSTSADRIIPGREIRPAADRILKPRHYLEKHEKIQLFKQMKQEVDYLQEKDKQPDHSKILELLYDGNLLFDEIFSIFGYEGTQLLFEKLNEEFSKQHGREKTGELSSLFSKSLGKNDDSLNQEEAPEALVFPELEKRQRENLESLFTRSVESRLRNSVSFTLNKPGNKVDLKELTTRHVSESIIRFSSTHYFNLDTDYELNWTDNTGKDTEKFRITNIHLFGTDISYLYQAEKD